MKHLLVLTLLAALMTSLCGFFQPALAGDSDQARLDRELEGGMAISAGRLRPDTQYDYKFVGLSHNTLRGAAGGAVLLAELLCAEGYIDHR